MQAVNMVRGGKSVREVARYFGYTHSAVVKWMRRAPQGARSLVLTASSRPHHHPRELDTALVRRILDLRESAHGRGAVHLHWLLQKEGIAVSLSSVKRTLSRNSTTKFTRWKKWHTYPERPTPNAPGLLVEADTIHHGPWDRRLYVYTLLDVFSRWAYAIPVERISTWKSLRFVEAAREAAPFAFQTLQTDHGSEFSKWLTKRLGERGVSHRHSRIRTPNDNAHLERWNRTIQEECLAHIPKKLAIWRREIPEFLRYYNEERPHQGLGMKTPKEMLVAVPRY